MLNTVDSPYFLKRRGGGPAGPLNLPQNKLPAKSTELPTNSSKMPISTFRHPQLLKPETFSPITKDSFAKNTTRNVPPAKKEERRRVTFNTRVSVRPMIHVNDISDEVIRDVWFCSDDFTNMKKGFARTVKLISFGVYQGDDDEHCARGLEYRIRAGALARRENKLSGLEAVLDEQDRQEVSCGVVNDELIRRAFLNVNFQCRLSALERGIKDQDEAGIIHDDCNTPL
jgi:hypothetical protein